MSKQFILNSICITLFGTFVGYSVTHVALGNANQNSLEMASLAPDNQHTLTKLASQQVYQDYFDVRIKHESISKTVEGQSVVKAIVTAKKDLPTGLSFKWKLGEDVATSEELAGELGSLKSGEQKEIFLRVFGFNKRSQKFLSFALTGKVDNHVLHRETLSSSRPEDSFEYVVQQNDRLEQERANENAKKNNGKLSTKSVRNKKFDLENVIK